MRCATVKVSAESARAGAVASNVFLESLTTRQAADSHNLMVVLAHLQGVAATFRVGRHHQNRGPLHEGQGLTHTPSLTPLPLTDLTVAAALVRKAYSKRRRSRLWSKPVNLRTCGLVSGHIVMVQAFAELRYGVVVHTRENSVKYGHNFNQTL